MIWQCMLMPAVGGMSQIDHMQAREGPPSRKPISIYYIPVSMHRELASLHCCIAYSKASIVWPDINAAVQYACVQLKSDWLFDRWWQTMPCWQHRQWQTPRKRPRRPAAYCVLPVSWRNCTTAIFKPGMVSLCIDCWLHLCIAHLVVQVPAQAHLDLCASGRTIGRHAIRCDGQC